MLYNCSLTPCVYVLAPLISFVLLSGCGTLIASQTSQFADSLSNAMLDSDDPATVSEAMPTFLVLLDGMLRDDNSVPLLLAAAKLNSAYASVFLNEGERQQKLAKKGFSYASKAACQHNKLFCSLKTTSYEHFQRSSQRFVQADVPVIYTLASSWLTVIQTNSGDWQAVAELPKVKLLLESVITLDESYDYGGAHLYLGGIATLLPPNLGGKPDIGKQHFERTIALSEGRHLLAKVEFARRYARLVFDQSLHHRLLTEVLEADIHESGLTLMNAIAQQQAKQLLAEEVDYF